MERVLHQSWQWVRAWVPPGITAIALLASMIGLWFVMMNPDRSLFAREQPSGPPAKVEPAPAARYRQAAAGPATSAASAGVDATSATAAPASDCAAMEKEIDSVTVRIRGAGKSKQGVRFRSRLRELKQLYGAECAPGAAPGN